MRFFFDFSYRGTRFHGWQRQPNAMSVQQVIEEALQKLTGQQLEILGSGRTDTGVHARQQIVQIDLDFEPDDQFLYRLNSILPKDIVVREVRKVTEVAHARFDALSRKYQYHIQRQPDPFTVGLAWQKTHKLDVSAMQEAAALLMEFEDFESFSKVNTDVKTFLCKITESRWERNGEQLIYHVRADRFLRGMVRALVGTQIDIGLGKLSVNDFEKIILAKDRRSAGQAAPPDGLYLWEVIYPDSTYLK